MPSTWTLNQDFSEMPLVTREAILTTAQHMADLLHAEFILVPVSLSIFSLDPAFMSEIAQCVIWAVQLRFSDLRLCVENLRDKNDEMK
jgi:hypothetical protein